MLKIVDADGKVRLIFGTEPADSFFDDNIRVRVIGGDDGGLVYVYGKDKQSSASLSVEKRGGAVDSDKFGEIECTSLKVVDAGGKASVLLTTDEHGGDVAIFGKDGISTASLSISESGGRIDATGDVTGNYDLAAASLGIGESGGFVHATGKKGTVMVRLSTTEHGGGVAASGKDGELVLFSIGGEHGGQVGVTGNESQFS